VENLMFFDRERAVQSVATPMEAGGDVHDDNGATVLRTQQLRSQV
jgi:hypothetical protein